MATNHNVVKPNNSNHLVLVNVIEGYQKGWNRLFSLPRDMNMSELVDLLAHSIHRTANVWGMKSAKLRSTIILGGRRYWSSTEIHPTSLDNAKMILGDLDAAAGPSGFGLRVEMWCDMIGGGEDGDYLIHEAAHDLKFIGRANPSDETNGKIVCLSVTNLAENDPIKADIAHEQRRLASCFRKERVLAYPET
ncbi:hypothetical protein MMC11_005536 [Xylographa trunciseda]|nr:hypothetical protein [Xylographa trunciseda]